MYQMYAYYKKYEAKEVGVKGVYLLYPLVENLSDIPDYRSEDSVNVKICLINLMRMNQSITDLRKNLENNRQPHSE